MITNDINANTNNPPSGEGRASSRPLSDGRMSSCPVVPMDDVRMTTHCQGNAALHLALGARAARPRRSRESATAHGRCGFQPRNASSIAGARTARPPTSRPLQKGLQLRIVPIPPLTLWDNRPCRVCKSCRGLWCLAVGSNLKCNYGADRNCP